MSLSFDTLSLPPGTFAILRDLIHERLGLYYEEAQRSLLADKLSARVVACGLSTFLDYYYFLKYDARGGDEWLAVMNALSVQETYFWREFDQIRALSEVLLPRYVAEHPGRPIRIWSAACATGEEPLTIAMALDQAGWFGRVPIEIVGSDASSAAIEKARHGLYRERSFRSLAPSLRRRYFEPAAGAWRISPSLARRVEWTVANVTHDAEVRELATAPFIFCRNVFIYLSERAIETAVGLFATYQPAQGHLCVGTSESLIRIRSRYELAEVGGAFVYQKGA